MLRLFLRLYFKSKLKKISSYICIVLILAIIIVNVEIRFDIHPISYIIIFISYLFSLFLYLEVKEKKICIIFDTKLNQMKYCDETGLEAFKKRKLMSGYHKWLLLTMIENEPDKDLPYSNISNISNYCFYCYFGIVLIIMLSVLFIIFLTLAQMFVIILVVVISVITFSIIVERRANNMRYIQLDSEIKQILFEEETGYSPLVKNKYTFKYKAWLKSEDEKIRTVPYRN